ncbi:MAG: TIGR01906 family membrane protein [Clostridia bacterium]|nr:TIGR01906 family membrane protein [Clostridia bacterium]
MKNKVLTTLYIISVAVLILTVSIALPIYFRPFYYMQIKPLELEYYSGYTFEQIITAYNSVLNYLTIPFTKFSVGELTYSNDGYLHFKDCKALFMLNFYALIISLILVIILLILNKKGKLTLIKFKGFSPAFYSSIIALLIPLILGTIAVINFDVAFTLFHTILFPGKTNWYFDPYLDPIILILPEKFFMACGILIAVLMLTICLTIITVNLVKKYNLNKQKTK